MKSLVSIQILRGVAAWLVVYHHYMQFFYGFNSNSKLGQFFSDWGDFGIDIFFVISGFIMFYSLAGSGYGAKEFLVKRILRITPVYWFYTFLIVFLSWVYSKEFEYTAWNLNTLVSSLVFIPTENPSGRLGYYPILTVGWTLNLEMFFYAWLSLCIFAFGRFRFLVCAITLIAFPLVWDEHWLYASILTDKYLYEFVFGLALGYAYQGLQRAKPYLSYTLGISLFLFAALLFQMNLTDLPGGQFSLNRSLLACLLVLSALSFETVLFKIKNNLFQSLRYLGDISYSTYLVHTLVIVVFSHYFVNSGGALVESFKLLLVSMTIVSLSHLSYQYIETGPYLKILKRKFIG